MQRLSFYLDLPADEHAAAVAFWCGVTGSEVSAPRGERQEYASLLPPTGDDHLRVQRVDDRPAGVHLDVYVPDLAAAVEHAVGCGATVVARPGHAVLHSPGGFPFCLVEGPAAEPSDPITWPDGHRSRADQLCLDIGPSAYAAECAFWSDLTGWPVRVTARTEFSRLQVPVALRARILLQRLEQDEGPVRGHLDIATDDRPAEVGRLQELGVEPVDEGPMWTVLRPPAGPVLCVTSRDPVTGTVS